MDEHYSKITTHTNRTNSNKLDYSSNYNSTSTLTIDRDNFQPIEYEDISHETSIFEVFKSKDYSDVLKNVIESIDNYYQENEAFDDYPYFRIQSTNRFVPKLDKNSEILSERQLRELHAHLPYYHQFKNLKLLYTMSKDGCSLKTFYYKSEDVKNSILLIKDDNQNVFGAFVSEPFRINTQAFYGTGETFLFSFFKTERIHCFPSTGLNDYYIYSDDKIVCFGCSDNYFSLSLENDFMTGYSKTTQTYKNPALSTKDNFFISKLELWTFEEQ
jgi:hypothetical protein